jgi:Spy/CpxP family protein refolding chaperone
MKRIAMALITVFFISGLVVAGADAQMAGGRGKGSGMGMGFGGGMGMWDGAHAMHVINALGLDEKQSTEVKSILNQLQKEMIKKRADIQVAEVELKEILGKDPVDVKAAETKVKQIASLKTEAAMMHIQGIEDVKAKLTPDQKKKLTEMMQMRGMGHGYGRMDCPMIKGQNMDKAPDAAVPPAKSRSQKSAPPVSTQ